MPAIHPTSRKRSSRELGCADMHSPGPFAALGTEGWARRPGWLRWAIVLFESGHRLLQGLLQGHVPVDLATHVPVLEPRCPEHAIDPVGLPSSPLLSASSDSYSPTRNSLSGLRTRLSDRGRLSIRCITSSTCRADSFFRSTSGG